ncbi:helix-turn-helix transcriptional regulator [Micromonospora inositola]|uniref:Helix-turn-helix domain-containing protein n=1 Tax=Micromonospora inositola TaxID=47865 RepID=A0A1C5K418_9ACTN|nr:helix-turn-helix transcriptional regulator [Micromonospora inositola]SCG77542.1 Helix-turn-helix domain-containing protein [Micromonospora inositola]
MGRSAIGEFLRSCRARISPEDVGLVTHGRRRVPGLRREEVALLSGVSTDYYVRVEQGRSQYVSESVLDAVGRALRLSADERAHLYDLARPSRKAGVAQRHPVRAGIRLLLESMPNTPAIVVDHRMFIVTANALGKALFELTDEPASRDRARYFFLDPHARTFFPDWHADADIVVAHLRLLAGRYPNDPGLTSLIGELCIKSAEFRAAWADYGVREKLHGAKRIHHPLAGDLELWYERLVISGEPEYSLITYTAASSSVTAERLGRLASSSGAGRI